METEVKFIRALGYDPYENKYYYLPIKIRRECIKINSRLVALIKT